MFDQLQDAISIEVPGGILTATHEAYFIVRRGHERRVLTTRHLGVIGADGNFVTISEQHEPEVAGSDYDDLVAGVSGGKPAGEFRVRDDLLPKIAEIKART